jgi:acyl-CoA synthetase (AMP-forming)/AMP-acid ligase II
MSPEAEQRSRIYDVVSFWAGEGSEAIAISGPGREGLPYRRLLKQVEYTVETLNGFGFGRNDRIAALVPNGPEMAVTFLSVAASAAILPLNPGYRWNEYAEYLSALRPRAVIMQSGLDSPVEKVSQELEIPIIRLIPRRDEPAGLFHLEMEREIDPRASNHQVGFAQPDDVALVLRTSGTTSTPKTVPLTNANLCLSAGCQGLISLDSDSTSFYATKAYRLANTTGGMLRAE